MLRGRSITNCLDDLKNRPFLFFLVMEEPSANYKDPRANVEQLHTAYLEDEKHVVRKGDKPSSFERYKREIQKIYSAFQNKESEDSLVTDYEKRLKEKGINGAELTNKTEYYRWFVQAVHQEKIFTTDFDKTTFPPYASRVLSIDNPHDQQKDQYTKGSHAELKKLVQAISNELIQESYKSVKMLNSSEPVPSNNSETLFLRRDGKFFQVYYNGQESKIPEHNLKDFSLPKEGGVSKDRALVWRIMLSMQTTHKINTTLRGHEVVVTDRFIELVRKSYLQLTDPFQIDIAYIMKDAKYDEEKAIEKLWERDVLEVSSRGSQNAYTLAQELQINQKVIEMIQGQSKVGQKSDAFNRHLFSLRNKVEDIPNYIAIDQEVRGLKGIEPRFVGEAFGNFRSVVVDFRRHLYAAQFTHVTHPVSQPAPPPSSLPPPSMTTPMNDSTSTTIFLPSAAPSTVSSTPLSGASLAPAPSPLGKFVPRRFVPTLKPTEKLEIHSEIPIFMRQEQERAETVESVSRMMTGGYALSPDMLALWKTVISTPTLNPLHAFFISVFPVECTRVERCADEEKVRDSSPKFKDRAAIYVVKDIAYWYDNGRLAPHKMSLSNTRRFQSLVQASGAISKGHQNFDLAKSLCGYTGISAEEQEAKQIRLNIYQKTATAAQCETINRNLLWAEPTFPGQEAGRKLLMEVRPEGFVLFLQTELETRANFVLNFFLNNPEFFLENCESFAVTPKAFSNLTYIFNKLRDLISSNKNLARYLSDLEQKPQITREHISRAKDITDKLKKFVWNKTGVLCSVFNRSVQQKKINPKQVREIFADCFVSGEAGIVVKLCDPDTGSHSAQWEQIAHQELSKLILARCDLYVMNKFNEQLCAQIPENAVVVCEDNTAYLIIKGAILRDGNGRPKIIDDISLQKSLVDYPARPTKGMLSNADAEKIVQEVTAKAGYVLLGPSPEEFQPEHELYQAMEQLTRVFLKRGGSDLLVNPSQNEHHKRQSAVITVVLENIDTHIQKTRSSKKPERRQAAEVTKLAAFSPSSRGLRYPDESSSPGYDTRVTAQSAASGSSDMAMTMPPHRREDSFPSSPMTGSGDSFSTSGSGSSFPFQSLKTASSASSSSSSSEILNLYSASFSSSFSSSSSTLVFSEDEREELLAKMRQKDSRMTLEKGDFTRDVLPPLPGSTTLGGESDDDEISILSPIAYQPDVADLTRGKDELKASPETADRKLLPAFIHAATLMLHHLQQFQDVDALEDHFKKIMSMGEEACFFFVLAVKKSPIPGPMQAIIKDKLLAQFAVALAVGLEPKGQNLIGFMRQGFAKYCGLSSLQYTDVLQVFSLDAVDTEFAAPTETVHSSFESGRLDFANKLMQAKVLLKQFLDINRRYLDALAKPQEAIALLLQKAAKLQVLPYFWYHREELCLPLLLRLIMAGLPDSLLEPSGLDEKKQPQAVVILKQYGLAVKEVRRAALPQTVTVDAAMAKSIFLGVVLKSADFSYGEKLDFLNFYRPDFIRVADSKEYTPDDKGTVDIKQPDNAAKSGEFSLWKDWLILFYSLPDFPEFDEGLFNPPPPIQIAQALRGQWRTYKRDKNAEQWKAHFVNMIISQTKIAGQPIPWKQQELFLRELSRDKSNFALLREVYGLQMQEKSESYQKAREIQLDLQPQLKEYKESEEKVREFDRSDFFNDSAKIRAYIQTEQISDSSALSKRPDEFKQLETFARCLDTTKVLRDISSPDMSEPGYDEVEEKTGFTAKDSQTIYSSVMKGSALSHLLEFVESAWPKLELEEEGADQFGHQLCPILHQVSDVTLTLPIHCFFQIMAQTNLWLQFVKFGESASTPLAVNIKDIVEEIGLPYGKHTGFLVGLELWMRGKVQGPGLSALIQFLTKNWQNNKRELAPILARRFNTAVDLTNAEDMQRLQDSQELARTKDLYKRIMIRVFLTTLQDEKTTDYATFSVLSYSPTLRQLKKKYGEILVSTNAKQAKVFLNQLVRHYTHHEEILKKWRYNPQLKSSGLQVLGELQERIMQFFIDSCEVNGQILENRGALTTLAEILRDDRYQSFTIPFIQQYLSQPRQYPPVIMKAVRETLLRHALQIPHSQLPPGYLELLPQCVVTYWQEKISRTSDGRYPRYSDMQSLIRTAEAKPVNLVRMVYRLAGVAEDSIGLEDHEQSFAPELQYVPSADGRPPVYIKYHRAMRVFRLVSKGLQDTDTSDANFNGLVKLQPVSEEEKSEPNPSKLDQAVNTTILREADIYVQQYFIHCPDNPFPALFDSRVGRMLLSGELRLPVIDQDNPPEVSKRFICLRILNCLRNSSNEKLLQSLSQALSPFKPKENSSVDLKDVGEIEPLSLNSLINTLKAITLDPQEKQFVNKVLKYVASRLPLSDAKQEAKPELLPITTEPQTQALDVPPASVKDIPLSVPAVLVHCGRTGALRRLESAVGVDLTASLSGLANLMDTELTHRSKSANGRMTYSLDLFSGPLICLDTLTARLQLEIQSKAHLAPEAELSRLGLEEKEEKEKEKEEEEEPFLLEKEEKVSELKIPSLAKVTSPFRMSDAKHSSAEIVKVLMSRLKISGLEARFETKGESTSNSREDTQQRFGFQIILIKLTRTYHADEVRDAVIREALDDLDEQAGALVNRDDPLTPEIYQQWNSLLQRMVLLARAIQPDLKYQSGETLFKEVAKVLAPASGHVKNFLTLSAAALLPCVAPKNRDCQDFRKEMMKEICEYMRDPDKRWQSCQVYASTEFSPEQRARYDSLIHRALFNLVQRDPRAPQGDTPNRFLGYDRAMVWEKSSHFDPRFRYACRRHQEQCEAEILPQVLFDGIKADFYPPRLQGPQKERLSELFRKYFDRSNQADTVINAIQAIPEIKVAPGVDYTFDYFAAFLKACLPAKKLRRGAIDEFIRQLKSSSDPVSVAQSLQEWCWRVINALPVREDGRKATLRDQLQTQLLSGLSCKNVPLEVEDRVTLCGQAVTILRQKTPGHMSSSAICTAISDLARSNPHLPLSQAYNAIKDDSQEPKTRLAAHLFSKLHPSQCNSTFSILFTDLFATAMAGKTPKAPFFLDEKVVEQRRIRPPSRLVSVFPVNKSFFKLIRPYLNPEDWRELKESVKNKLNDWQTQLGMANIIFNHFSDEFDRDQIDLLRILVTPGKSRHEILTAFNRAIYATGSGYQYLAQRIDLTDIDSMQRNTAKITGLLKAAKQLFTPAERRTHRLHKSNIALEFLAAIRRNYVSMDSSSNPENIIRDLNKNQVLTKTNIYIENLFAEELDTERSAEYDQAHPNPDVMDPEWTSDVPTCATQTFQKIIDRDHYLSRDYAWTRIICLLSERNTRRKVNRPGFIARYLQLNYIQDLIVDERRMSSHGASPTRRLDALITYLSDLKNLSKEDSRRIELIVRLRARVYSFSDSKYGDNRKKFLASSHWEFLEAKDSKEHDLEPEQIVFTEWAERIKDVLDRDQKFAETKSDADTALQMLFQDLLGEKGRSEWQGLNQHKKRGVGRGTRRLDLFGQAVAQLNVPQCWQAWLLLFQRIDATSSLGGEKKDTPVLGGSKFENFLKRLSEIIKNHQETEFCRQVAGHCLLTIQASLCDPVRVKRQLASKLKAVKKLCDGILSVRKPKLQLAALKALITELSQDDGLQINIPQVFLDMSQRLEKDGNISQQEWENAFKKLPKEISRASLQVRRNLVENAQRILRAVGMNENTIFRGHEQWFEILGAEVAGKLQKLASHLALSVDVRIALNPASKHDEAQESTVAVIRNCQALLADADIPQLKSTLAATSGSVVVTFFQYYMTWKGEINLSASEDIQECLGQIKAQICPDIKSDPTVSLQQLEKIIHLLFAMLKNADVTLVDIVLRKILLTWNEFAHERVLQLRDDLESLGAFKAEMVERVKLVFTAYRQVFGIPAPIVSTIEYNKLLPGSLTVLHQLMRNAEPPNGDEVTVAKHYLHQNWWRDGGQEFKCPDALEHKAESRPSSQLRRGSGPAAERVQAMTVAFGLRTDVLSLPNKLSQPFTQDEIKQIKSGPIFRRLTEHKAGESPCSLEELVHDLAFPGRKPSDVKHIEEDVNYKHRALSQFCKHIAETAMDYATQQLIRNVLAAVAPQQGEARSKAVAALIKAIPHVPYTLCEVKGDPTEADKLRVTRDKEVLFISKGRQYFLGFYNETTRQYQQQEIKLDLTYETVGEIQDAVMIEAIRRLGLAAGIPALEAGLFHTVCIMTRNPSAADRQEAQVNRRLLLIKKGEKYYLERVYEHQNVNHVEIKPASQILQSLVKDAAVVGAIHQAGVAAGVNTLKPQLAWFHKVSWIARQIVPDEDEEIDAKDVHEVKVDGDYPFPFTELVDVDYFDTNRPPYDKNTAAFYQQAWQTVVNEKRREFQTSIVEAGAENDEIRLLRFAERRRGETMDVVRNPHNGRFELEVDVNRFARDLEEHFKAMGVTGYQQFGPDGVVQGLFDDRLSYEANLRKLLNSPRVAEWMVHKLVVKSAPQWRQEFKDEFKEEDIKSPLDILDSAFTKLTPFVNRGEYLEVHLAELIGKIRRLKVVTLTADKVTESMRQFFSIFSVANDETIREIHCLFIKKSLQWALDQWKKGSVSSALIVAVLKSINRDTQVEPEQVILNKLLAESAVGTDVNDTDIENLKEKLRTQAEPITQWTLVENVAKLQPWLDSGKIYRFRGQGNKSGLLDLVPYIRWQTQDDPTKLREFFDRDFDSATEIVTFLACVLRKLEFDEQAILLHGQVIINHDPNPQNYLIDYLRGVKGILLADSKRVEDSEEEKQPSADLAHNETICHRLDRYIALLQNRSFLTSGEFNRELAFAWGHIPLDGMEICRQIIAKPAEQPVALPSGEVTEHKDEKKQEQDWGKPWRKLNERIAVNALGNRFLAAIGEEKALKERWAVLSTETDQSGVLDDKSLLPVLRIFNLAVEYADFMKKADQEFKEAKDWRAPIIDFFNKMEQALKANFLADRGPEIKSAGGIGQYIAKVLDVPALGAIPTDYAKYTDLFEPLFGVFADRLLSALKSVDWPKTPVVSENDVGIIISQFGTRELTFPAYKGRRNYLDLLFRGQEDNYCLLDRNECLENFKDLLQYVQGLYQIGTEVRDRTEQRIRAKIKKPREEQYNVLGNWYIRLNSVEDDKYQAQQQKLVREAACSIVVNKVDGYYLQYLRAVEIYKITGTPTKQQETLVKNGQAVLVRQKENGQYELTFCPQGKQKCVKRDFELEPAKAHIFSTVFKQPPLNGVIGIDHALLRNEILGFCLGEGGIVTYRENSPARDQKEAGFQCVEKKIEDARVIELLNNSQQKSGVLDNEELVNRLRQLCSPPYPQRSEAPVLPGSPRGRQGLFGPGSHPSPVPSSPGPDTRGNSKEQKYPTPSEGTTVSIPEDHKVVLLSSAAEEEDDDDALRIVGHPVNEHYAQSPSFEAVHPLTGSSSSLFGSREMPPRDDSDIAGLDARISEDAADLGL